MINIYILFAFILIDLYKRNFVTVIIHNGGDSS